MFEGFETRFIDIEAMAIHFRIGGDGPPLLLLHGCPQTHIMWRDVAPELAKDFTVVVADLRGYGDSGKPAGLSDHSNYSFRVMAADQRAPMGELGFASFEAIGHDRGARVLHRMARDYPASLTRLTVIDVLPTDFMYAHTDKKFATAYWEWFLNIQTNGFPEALYAANPEAVLRHHFRTILDKGSIGPEAWKEYLRAFLGAGAIHSMCEDYRAAATIDLVHDAVDAERKLGIPMMALWGSSNPIWADFDMLEVWRKYATNVVGEELPTGHFVVEELPQLVTEKLQRFHTG